MTPKLRMFGLAVSSVLVAGLLLPTEASAQRWYGYGGYRAAVVVGGPYYPYYRPYYSPFFYDPFFWGWGYWQYPYPPPYYYGIYDRTGAARLQVKPKEAQVFVDGYFVGRVDDFDGSLQRLHVEAGEHELELYLDGFKTERQKVLFRREGTITVKHVMQPLAAGETSERPTPIQPPPPPPGNQATYARPPDNYPGGPPARVPPQGRGDRNVRSEDFGTLAIRVQPGDAEVVIDGDHWDGSDQGSRLSVQLSEGPHRVEIRKDGYRPYTANVRITRGQTETLNVSLSQ